VNGIVICFAKRGFHLARTFLNGNFELKWARIVAGGAGTIIPGRTIKATGVAKRGIAPRTMEVVSATGKCTIL